MIIRYIAEGFFGTISGADNHSVHGEGLTIVNAAKYDTHALNNWRGFELTWCVPTFSCSFKGVTRLRGPHCTSREQCCVAGGFCFLVSLYCMGIVSLL